MSACRLWHFLHAQTFAAASRNWSFGIHPGLFEASCCAFESHVASEMERYSDYGDVIPARRKRNPWVLVGERGVAGSGVPHFSGETASQSFA